MVASPRAALDPADRPGQARRDVEDGAGAPAAGDSRSAANSAPNAHPRVEGNGLDPRAVRPRPPKHPTPA